MAINSLQRIAFAEDTGLLWGADIDPILFEESVEEKPNQK